MVVGLRRLKLTPTISFRDLDRGRFNIYLLASVGLGEGGIPLHSGAWVRSSLGGVMFRSGWFLALVGALSFSGVHAQSSLSTLPTGTGATSCSAQEAAAFSSGYGAGQAAGFTDGYGHGADDGAAFCVANPLLCGITLDSCLPPAEYGETEPNDNLVAADPLPFNVNFWGQSYGAVDEDWFYVVTTQANQNLTVNFSVPDGAFTGWIVSIRDAAGNLFAEFDTSSVGNVSASTGGISYRVTLGLVGTYYLVVRPVAGSQNFSPYNIAAVLQDSPLDSQNFVVGFSDVELEPNDIPGQSTWLTAGVTMYGVINLQFDAVEFVSDGTAAYLQGEWDWYAYISDGSEVVTLSFCDRQACPPGNWFIEVYNKANANAAAVGSAASPLIAINTDTTSDEPLVYRIGLGVADTYYLRVNHKRLLEAPCSGYSVDLDNNGIVDGGSCACASGQRCDLTSVLPASLGTSVVEGTGEEATTSWFCPDGNSASVVGGTQENPSEIQCATTCECVQWINTVAIPEGALTSQYNFTWQATQLPPGTYATDAYQDFISRPSPY